MEELFVLTEEVSWSKNCVVIEKQSPRHIYGQTGAVVGGIPSDGWASVRSSLGERGAA